MFGCIFVAFLLIFCEYLIEFCSRKWNIFTSVFIGAYYWRREKFLFLLATMSIPLQRASNFANDMVVCLGDPTAFCGRDILSSLSLYLYLFFYFFFTESVQNNRVTKNNDFEMNKSRKF